MNKEKLVEKPWGREYLFAKARQYAGKILIVHKGQSLSKQYHKYKTETLMPIEGKCRILTGEKWLEPELWEPVHIPNGMVHRIEAIEETKLVEVSSNELNDVVRLSDNYGRCI